MAKSITRGYIKSIAELKGAFDIADDLSDGAGYQVSGTISMKRDAKLTGMAVKAVFAINNNATTDWENCGEDAMFCEEYFVSNGEDTFDLYLADKYDDGLENFWDDNDGDLSPFELTESGAEALDTVYENIYNARTLGRKSIKTEGGESDDDQGTTEP
jgi:hypothetical protein